MAFTPGCAQTRSPSRGTLRIGNDSGLQLVVDTGNTSAVLRVVLPGRAASDRAIEVLTPEHVTAVKHGDTVGTQLYMYRGAGTSVPPAWRRRGRSLEYERELPGSVHLLARATLENDGVRLRYEFTNHSDTAYDMVTAVTDPRLTSIFHDERLERTYVHHATGLDLLASETPERLTLPRDQWLPARYLASFAWPVQSRRVERRGGITYYNKSRRVDQPFIATISSDSRWVVASFARGEVGNVWSNPELTCQHVHQQTLLAPRGRAHIEMKMFVMRGSLDDALRRALAAP